VCTWSPTTGSRCASCDWANASAGASKWWPDCAPAKRSPPIPWPRCRPWSPSARRWGPAMNDGLRMGLPGRLAAAFQANPLTPVLALLGLLLGLVAVLVTPREEEPQIDVTMANVIVPFEGASARDVEQLVSTPLEQKLSEIEGVKHVHSVSRPGMAVLTVEYTVGIERQPAIVRLYNQVFSNQDWLPPGIGVGQPLVKPKGIDDVPVM